MFSLSLLFTIFYSSYLFPLLFPSLCSLQLCSFNFHCQFLLYFHQPLLHSVSHVFCYSSFFAHFFQVFSLTLFIQLSFFFHSESFPLYYYVPTAFIQNLILFCSSCRSHAFLSSPPLADNAFFLF